jgi:hypothetical protein
MARKQMKANPESRQAEGKNATANSQITKPLTPTTTLPAAPEARVTACFDTVTPVNRTRPAECPESARQRNNRSRDMRTNLGTGKTSIVEVE